MLAVRGERRDFLSEASEEAWPRQHLNVKFLATEL